MSCARWFALHVNSKRETRISVQLRMKGYEEFVPQYSERRRLAYGTREATLPLFPGYVFCKLDLNERILPVLTTPGVIGMVGAGRTPVAIDDLEIDAIKAAVAFGQIEPYPQLGVGQRVEMIEGPLAGYEGVIARVKNSWRLIISVALLQRSISVEIDRRWARPVSRTPFFRSPGILQDTAV
jgi:transcription antitermination factor NusG